MKKKIIFTLSIIILLFPSNYVRTENAEDYSELGAYYYNQGDYDKSIYYYTKAIDLEPYNPRNYYQRSVSYASKANYVKSIEDYTKYYKLSRNTIKKGQFSDYWFDYYFFPLERYYSYGYYDEGYKKGIMDFTNAISYEPNNPHHYWRRGLLYFYLLYGNEEQNMQYAIEDFTKAIKLDPYNADYYYWRGLAYENKDYGKAIEDFNKATELEPYHYHAYSSMGWIYYEMENYNMAINKYTKALEIVSDDLPSLYYRGMSYYNIGDYSKARIDFDKLKQAMCGNTKDCYTGTYVIPDMPNSSDLGPPYMAPIIGALLVFILFYLKRINL